jgi:hypothetical protein
MGAVTVAEIANRAARPRFAGAFRAHPDLPPRPRHRLKFLREVHLRFATSIYFARGIKRIDCHLVFLTIAARDAT